MTARIADDLLDGGLAEDLASTALAMARRFQAGATLWCAAPSWEPHAHHVAVEFVHPVIVGKRALPAFALAGADLVRQARVAVRPGDILIVVAGRDEADAADLMRRADAWGALSVWIGWGERSARPPAGAAGHVLWAAGADPLAPVTGSLVLLYHLLWELTHVCFEHPGLLGGPASCDSDACITCGDEGRLGEVVTPPTGGPLARAVVRTASGTEDVDVTLVGPVAAGDLILVHAGMALTRAS